MQQRLDDIIDTIRQVDTREALGDTIVGLRDSFEVEHLVYHSVNGEGVEYASSTYPDNWVTHYLGEGYSRIDPVVQASLRQFAPVEWHMLDWSVKSARSFLGEATDAGIGNQGLSMPIRGPKGQFALFTVCDRASNDRWDTYRAEHAANLINVAHFVNQKALDLDPVTKTDPAPKLSPREIDALTLLAIGLSRGRAAETLSISEHTLRVYIEGARFKLGAQNTTHAVALALTHELISI